MKEAQAEQAETQNPPHKDVPIVRLDGGTENLRILELPMDKWDDAAGVMLDELALVNMCTTKPPGWVRKNVSGRSMAALADAVEEVNAPFFAYCARRMARLQQMAPGAVESILRVQRG